MFVGATWQYHGANYLIMVGEGELPAAGAHGAGDAAGDEGTEHNTQS
jgi:hypothetical protein